MRHSNNATAPGLTTRTIYMQGRQHTEYACRCLLLAALLPRHRLALTLALGWQPSERCNSNSRVGTGVNARNNVNEATRRVSTFTTLVATLFVDESRNSRILFDQ